MYNKTAFIALFIFLNIYSFAQTQNAVKENYTKQEILISMRDGVKLFTSIYIPKDISATKKYPILMQRTCYGVGPYGDTAYKNALGPSSYLMNDKYIFVYQDVRGRFMSEGKWTNMTPVIENKKNKNDVDEVSDTYDTVDWLIKNIKNNNGKVGIWGISYPGFYAACATMSNHPAIKAVSPQAPISDFWYDDFHHNGAFLQSYFDAFPVFGVQKNKPESKSWWKSIKPNTKDGFQFYMDMGAIKNGFDKYYEGKNFFINEIIAHPNYDEFWQKRSLLTKFNNNVKTAVMTVGGWFDAEDLAGPLNVYKTIEAKNPNIYNTLVMTPFGHGRWSRETGHTLHNDIYFGDSIASFYQREIEARFFSHFLKNDKETLSLPEAYMFNTGTKQWQKFDNWPLQNVTKQKFYLAKDEKLLTNEPLKNGFVSFVSDPLKPVPNSQNRKEMLSFSPHNYMSEDQRFAAQRPDVMVYETPILQNDMTITGPIIAHLNVETSSTDADWIVKIIDVYPAETENHPYLSNPDVILSNYYQMVRSEIMPGRFRNSFEKPEAFVPNQKTSVQFKLQDVLHTFKKGHRLMIQVQSTCFPLFMRNPQKFLHNVYLAEDKDFTKATHKIYYDSFIEMDVLK